MAQVESATASSACAVARPVILSRVLSRRARQNKNRSLQLLRKAHAVNSVHTGRAYIRSSETAIINPGLFAINQVDTCLFRELPSSLGWTSSLSKKNAWSQVIASQTFSRRLVWLLGSSEKLNSGETKVWRRTLSHFFSHRLMYCALQLTERLHQAIASLAFHFEGKMAVHGQTKSTLQLWIHANNQRKQSVLCNAGLLKIQLAVAQACTPKHFSKVFSFPNKTKIPCISAL